MKTAALIALLLLQTNVFGQSVSSSVVNSGGNSYTQGYYSIDWSVGELALVTTLKSNDGLFIVTSGLLQPDVAPVSTNHHFTADELKILPNPTYNKVELNFATRQQGTLLMNVYDATGKLVITQKANSAGTSSIERIDLMNLSSGTYLFRVELDPAPGSVRKTGTYKILKL